MSIEMHSTSNDHDVKFKRKLRLLLGLTFKSPIICAESGKQYATNEVANSITNILGPLSVLLSLCFGWVWQNWAVLIVGLAASFVACILVHLMFPLVDVDTLEKERRDDAGFDRSIKKERINKGRD